MTIRARIEAIESECSGCWAQSNITSWERDRLEEWKKLEHLSDKQEKILRQIESKAFGKDD